MLKKICTVIVLFLIAGCLASCNKKTIQEPAESSDSKPESYYTSYKQGVTTGKFLETPYGTYFSSVKVIYTIQRKETQNTSGYATSLTAPTILKTAIHIYIHHLSVTMTIRFTIKYGIAFTVWIWTETII